MAASFCTAQAVGQPPHVAHRPAPPIQYVLRVQAAGDTGSLTREHVLDLSPSMEPVVLDATVEMPAPWPSPRITRYLSQAVLNQLVVPAEDGKGGPALLLAIEGPKQSYERWLLADDATRNRLVSLIGFWRYMAVADAAQRDELFRQFKSEGGEQPLLTVRRADLRADVPLKIGDAQEVAAPKCTVKIVEFFPHLVLDPTSRRPVNMSNEPVNPAVRVELKAEGEKDERWVFARHPEMNTGGKTLPQFALSFSYPSQRRATTPDFVLVSVAGAPPELFQRVGDTIETPRPAPDQKITIPESNYTFRIARFIPHARLHEEYEMSLAADARPALRLEIPGAQPTPVWIELGKKRVITTAGGALTVEFNRIDAAARGGHP